MAYNPVRWVMAAAATLADVLPRVLRFMGAERLLGVFTDRLRQVSGKRMSLIMGIVLANIAALKLPYRPSRIEPRARKRQPKPLPLLSVPRLVARDEVLARRTLRLAP